MKDIKLIYYFIFGLLLGVIIRFLDYYTQNLGNVFSQFSIWILLCTLITIKSKLAIKAMIRTFLFCFGMLITYYITAILTNGVYSSTYIIGWSIFCFITPLLSYLTWLSQKDKFSFRLIALLIIIVSVCSTILFFDRLRFYDYTINLILAYFLFFSPLKN